MDSMWIDYRTTLHHNTPMTYLDWAATALPDPEIIEAMAAAAVEFPGNPSSPYPSGKAARSTLEEARERCAAVIGCPAECLSFTSGGTESNGIILLSRLLSREPGTLLISGLEHPSVAQPAGVLESMGWQLKEIAPGPDGRLSPDKLSSALEKNPEVRLVAVMGVNNETGAVQPLTDLLSVLRDFQFRGAGNASSGPGGALKASGRASPGRPIHFHADLVQTVGKYPVNLAELDVDSASFAAHKIRGPRGVGLLYHRNPKFEALIRGGGQEKGVRPGTENVAGAVAMAMALEKYGRPDDRILELSAWLLEELVKIDKVKIVPEARKKPVNRKNYVPNIISAAFPPIPGEVLARVLAESGFAVSTGSACSNNKKGKLPKAMLAMGVAKEIATGMIRISLGSATTKECLEDFLKTLKAHVSVLSMVNYREKKT